MSYSHLNEDIKQRMFKYYLNNADILYVEMVYNESNINYVKSLNHLDQLYELIKKRRWSTSH